MNQFTLSFHPFDLRISQRQVVAFVKNSRDVLSWYSPFPGTIVFKSHLPFLVVAELFRDFFDGHSYIVSQTFPTATGGAQGQQVWDWINTGQIPALPQET